MSTFSVPSRKSLHPQTSPISPLMVLLLSDIQRKARLWPGMGTSSSGASIRGTSSSRVSSMGAASGSCRRTNIARSWRRGDAGRSDRHSEPERPFRVRLTVSIRRGPRRAYFVLSRWIFDEVAEASDAELGEGHDSVRVLGTVDPDQPSSSSRSLAISASQSTCSPRSLATSAKVRT